MSNMIIRLNNNNIFKSKKRKVIHNLHLDTLCNHNNNIRLRLISINMCKNINHNELINNNI